MTAAHSPFGLSPRPRVYGVFARTRQIEVLQSALRSMGIPTSEITVLEGESGILALDLSGEQGGAAKRFLTFTEGVTDERREIGKYIVALREGRQVVMINMPADDTNTKEHLRLAFQQAGASSIYYFGHLINEELPT